MLDGTEILVLQYGATSGRERCHWENAVNRSHNIVCRQRINPPLRQLIQVQEKSLSHHLPVTDG